MIFVRLISGLGNQLFQYTIGRQLSIVRKVPLKLDISFFSDQKLRNFKLNHYNITAEIATDREVQSFLKVYKSNGPFTKIYRKVERHLPKKWHTLYKQTNWWAYEADLLKVSSNVYLDGYWQHHQYFQNIDSAVFNELTLKESYNLSPGYNFSDLQCMESSVSVHVRRGDYISDPNANNLMGVLPIEYYLSAIDVILQKVSNPCFFVFSDDLNWVRNNLKFPGSVKFVEIENGKWDYVELDLMSKCRHNIIANSTFSWWGAFLNRNPDKIVIAPDKWVVPQELNDKVKLQFPSWIKL